MIFKVSSIIISTALFGAIIGGVLGATVAHRMVERRIILAPLSPDNPAKTTSKFVTAPTTEIIGDDNSVRPALNVLSRVGMSDGRQIGGVVVHNYTYGPGIQIDQVGDRSAVAVLKQARNVRQMPESFDKVSDAPFMTMLRADDGVVPVHVITEIDALGNIVFEDDSQRQESRSIRTHGSDLKIVTQKGKSVIFNQPVQLPIIDPDESRPLDHTVGVLPNGNLAVFGGGKWREYAPVK